MSNDINSIVDKLLENRNLENKKRFYNIIQFNLALMKSARKGISKLQLQTGGSYGNGIMSTISMMQSIMLLLEIELTDFDKFMKDELNITGTEIEEFKQSITSLLDKPISNESNTSSSIPNPFQTSSFVNPLSMGAFQTTDPFTTSNADVFGKTFYASPYNQKFPQDMIYEGHYMPKMPYDNNETDKNESEPTTPKIDKHLYYKMPASPTNMSDEYDHTCNDIHASTMPTIPMIPILTPKFKKKSIDKNWKKPMAPHELPKKKYNLKKYIMNPKFNNNTCDSDDDTISEDDNKKNTNDNHVEI